MNELIRRQTIFKRNRDLLERVERLEVALDYLKEDDVFLITIGRPRSSVSLTLDKNMIVHYSESNYKITGFTITNVREWLKTQKKSTDVIYQLPKISKQNEYVDQIAVAGLSAFFPTFAL